MRRGFRWLFLPLLCLPLVSCQTDEETSYYADLISGSPDWEYVRCSSEDSLEDVYRVFSENNNGSFVIPRMIESRTSFDYYDFRTYSESGTSGAVAGAVDRSQIYYYSKLFDSISYDLEYEISVYCDPVDLSVDTYGKLDYEELETGTAKYKGTYSYYRFSQSGETCFDAVIFYFDDSDPEDIAELFSTRWTYLSAEMSE